MPRRPDSAGEADPALWQRAMRDVRPLRPHHPPHPGPRPQFAPPPGLREPNPRPLFPPQPLERFAGIDRANAEKLKRGQHRIEARLDLHGLTQTEAHGALTSFIHASRGAGKRCVLIITGRSGVLRPAVPRWLAEAELRPHLLAIAAAQPRDGGSGALYVMLRRTQTV
jgi:DNA-nicking Smr family endonuclease